MVIMIKADTPHIGGAGDSSDNGPRIEFNIVICICISDFTLLGISSDPTHGGAVLCWAGNMIPNVIDLFRPPSFHQHNWASKYFSSSHPIVHHTDDQDPGKHHHRPVERHQIHWSSIGPESPKEGKERV